MKNQCTRKLTGNVILIKKEDFDEGAVDAYFEGITKNDAINNWHESELKLSEEEKELIYQKECKKYKGSSWGVELKYHKETFMSGIDALIDFLNNQQ